MHNRNVPLACGSDECVREGDAQKAASSSWEPFFRRLGAVKLIFNSWRSQAIDRMRKNALRRGRGTTLRSFGVGSGVRDLAQGRWQGDAEGGEREGGGGTRGGAQQEALAVLFDLGLGERVEIGDDVGPGDAGAGAGEAVFQLLLQNEGEEAAGDVAADRLIQFVIDRPRLEQTLGRAERPLDIPLTLPLIN